MHFVYHYRFVLIPGFDFGDEGTLKPFYLQLFVFCSFFGGGGIFFGFFKDG